MKKAYCVYPSTNENYIGISGIDIDKLKEVLPYSVWEETSDALHLVKRDPNKGDLFCLDGQSVSPCDLCKHRLVEITGGCKPCSFKNEEVSKTLREEEKDNEKKIVAFLQQQKVEKINVSHLVSESSFSTFYFSHELNFDEVKINENREKLKRRSQEAVQSKAFKKSTCTSCAFAKEGSDTCIISKPRFCRTHSQYETIEEIKEKALSYVKNIDRLLCLSLLCGRKLRIEGKRYRLSCVLNEEKGLYLATQDYAPWETKEISYEDVSKALEGAPFIFDSSAIAEMTLEEKEEHAATYILLRKNWDNVSSIAGYQKQHMFWASFNTFQKRVDIEIHLSKNTYPYHYNNVKELLTSTKTIQI